MRKVATLLVAACAEVQAVAVLDETVHGDAAREQPGGSAMRQDRHAVAARRGGRTADVVGVVVRENHRIEAPALDWGRYRIEVSEAALALIARAAEGSMCDAQSALDQVIAFSGQTVSVEDVSTVLGLVGRDLLLDLIEAVVEEDGPRAFAVADRAVESGHDLKLVCRELSQVVRDMMMLAVDPGRAGDGELAEDERERLTGLGRRFSR